MPNRFEHQAAGLVVSALLGMWRSRHLQGGDWWWHNAGAAIGGAFMGRAPDQLEPAFSPHHRQFFHAILPNTIFLWWAYGNVEQAYRAVLAYAERYPVTPHVYPWERAALFVLAGAIQGAPSAYASHLVLDFLTPRRLPFVGRLPLAVN